MDKLSKFLNEKLREKGITRHQLHLSSGVTYSYLSDIFSGKKIPELKIIERIANALGIAKEVILVEGGLIDASKVHHESDGMPSDINDIASLLKLIPEEKRKQIVEPIKSMVKAFLGKD